MTPATKIPVGDEPAPTRTDIAGRPSEVASHNLRVIVVGGPDVGKVVPLGPIPIEIGKRSNCTLSLNDPSVSRQHGSLSVREGAVLFSDLESKNGSFVGGVRVTQCQLSPGTTLRVGMTLLQVRAGEGGDEDASLAAPLRFGRMTTASVKMQEVFAHLARAARTDATVLIEAETGCGKELCAEAVHEESGRTGPLVICDLAGVTRSLLESDLFGHVRGAFTGATSDRVGAFVQSRGGSLFLDELSKLDLELQPRLLRALQERQVRPLGSARPQSFDGRIIAATNRSLAQEVEAGTFREDLYHRLAVIRVRLPPLRDRVEDVEHLGRRFAEERGLLLAPETLAVLREYRWPGNVRELRNTIDRAASLLGTRGPVVEPRHLQLDTPSGRDNIQWPHVGDAGFVESRKALLETWEKNYIEQLLERTGGNVSLAARQSGIGRVHLHRLIRRFKLKPPREG